MFKKLFLASFMLMIGCASSLPPVASPPTPVVVDPTANMQVPVTLPKPVSPVTDKQVFKGDLWEVRASNDWKKANNQKVQLLLFTKDEQTVAILDKMENVLDLDGFAAEVTLLIKEMGGQPMTRRTAYINTRKSVEVEALMAGGITWTWTFVTGAEGYTFTCGGEVAAFEKNRQLCTDLLKGLYIGKAP